MHTLLLGDCVEVMKTMQENSIDSLIADPPAGISFMGKEWDSNKGGRDKWIAWLTEVMQEAFRVMKPGAHGLVWALPRTSHWTAMALENAGFEIRDRVAHIFGNGFPKSLNVGKKLPEWEGWGTALKPAMEDWWLIRKPLSENTVVANILKWGTGAINIDDCRIEIASKDNSGHWTQKRELPFGGGGNTGIDFKRNHHADGRFPAHVILDGSDEVLAYFPESEVSGSAKNGKPATGEYHKDHHLFSQLGRWQGTLHNDSGSAARFFYCAKASSADREEGLEGSELHEAEGFDAENGGYNVRTWIDRKDGKGKVPVNAKRNPRANHHPTVKSTELMRYLCRLVTPPNGTILDCFVGSGSTGKGAVIEGFNFIGIDKEQEYLDIAEKRITAKYLPLFQQPPRQPTQREPDKRDSAASQAFSQPDFLSDLESLS